MSCEVNESVRGKPKLGQGPPSFIEARKSCKISGLIIITFIILGSNIVTEWVSFYYSKLLYEI